MIHTISEPLTEIEVGASGIREIIQNVSTILATTKGEVVLDRTFGINSDIIDSPSLLGIAQYRKTVIEEIERQEPRVSVVSVEFKNIGESVNGTLYPIVKIKIKDGVLL